MDDLPENAPEEGQPQAPAPPEGPDLPAPDPWAALRQDLALVRDHALAAIRQHDLPTLARAVHDLADALHRMISAR